jgi:hypothetical protein
MLVALRGPGDHDLNAGQLLIDLIMNLKVDCPKIQEYLHISKYDSLFNRSRMCLTAFTLLMSIGMLPDAVLG